MKKKIIEFLRNLDKRWQSMNEKQRMAAAAISVVVGILPPVWRLRLIKLPKNVRLL